MADIIAPFVLFDAFRQELGRKAHDLENDTLMAFLSNDAPVPATDATTSDFVPLTPGNGYAEWDIAASYSQSGGVASLTGTGTTVTPTTGDVGPFRYLGIYNSSASNKLIGYVDYGTAITIRPGETFDVTLGTLMTFP